MYITMPNFYIGAGDLNTGPHARVTHTLPTKLSPQPEATFLVVWANELMKMARAWKSSLGRCTMTISPV